MLARDCIENQILLANENASAPLVHLLGADMLETQESALTALLCLASHAESRDVVVKRLVVIRRSHHMHAFSHARTHIN